MVSKFWYNFLVPKMIELACKTFMPIQTLFLHRVTLMVLLPILKMFLKPVKMFLKPVWVGKIHGVEVYATHVVRIWWFSNTFSIFQLKRM